MAEITGDNFVIVRDWEKVLVQYNAVAAKTVYPSEIYLLVEGGWKNITECKKVA